MTGVSFRPRELGRFSAGAVDFGDRGLHVRRLWVI